MRERWLIGLVLILSAVAAWWAAHSLVPPPRGTRARASVLSTGARSGTSPAFSRTLPSPGIASTLPAASVHVLEQPNMEGPPADLKAVDAPAPAQANGLADGPPNADAETQAPPDSPEEPIGPGR